MLKKLNLENFRNYSKLELEFQGKGLSYLIGDNAQGKTNFLEAIYCLIMGKSFLDAKNDFLIGFGKEFARIKGEFENSDNTENFELFLGLPPNPRRALKINDIRTTLANYLGKNRVIIFHPFDLNLLFLGTEKRRAFLDNIILQRNKKYAEALKKFNKTLKQRNALLKKIGSGEARQSELEIWTEQLIESGVVLVGERCALARELNSKIENIYSKIAGANVAIKIEFKSNLGVNQESILEISDLEAFYRARIAQRAENELAAEYTLIGPHRDNFEIIINDHEATGHASRGEIRTLILALKMLEIEILAENGQAEPIVLLDDVLSELDHQRQIQLLQNVKQFQTFISTTKDSANINQEKLLPGRFLEIKNGHIAEH